MYMSGLLQAHCICHVCGLREIKHIVFYCIVLYKTAKVKFFKIHDWAKLDFTTFMNY